MIFKGIKLKIFSSFFLLLTLAMVLICIVMVYFWQRSLIQNELDHVASVVQLWGSQNIDKKYSEIATDKQMNSLCLAIGENCQNIYLSENISRISSLQEERGDHKDSINKCLTNNVIVTIKEEVVWSFLFIRDRTLKIFFPCNSIHSNNFAIGVKLDFSPIYKKINTSISVLLFYIFVNALVIATIGFFRIAKTVLKPIDKLISLSEGYTQSGELAFTNTPTKNEFGRLSFALNNMVGRINEDKLKLRENIRSLKEANRQLIDSQKQVVRSEKLAAVGKLSAGLAHEIGNPIGIAQGYIELLENKDLSDNDRIQFSQRAVKELDRIDKMVRQLLDFSRNTSKKGSRTSAARVCQGVKELLNSQKNSDYLQISVEMSSGYDDVPIGYDELYQVLINCVFNSIDAIKERGVGFLGCLEIETCIKNTDTGSVIITIKDNGVGIPDEELNSVFDPFFTTKDVGSGTGLGLSVSYSIIETFGGKMEVESKYGEGTEIIIQLPLCDPDIGKL